MLHDIFYVGIRFVNIGLILFGILLTRKRVKEYVLTHWGRFGELVTQNMTTIIIIMMLVQLTFFPFERH